jgi:hypothetical protein
MQGARAQIRKENEMAARGDYKDRLQREHEAKLEESA